MSNEEKIKFLIQKMGLLAGAIYVFLDAHEISPEFFEFAKNIDWVAHFETALVEYNRTPTKLQDGQ